MDWIAQIPSQSKVEILVMTAKEKAARQRPQKEDESERQGRRCGAEGKGVVGPGTLCIMVEYVEYRLRQVFTLSLSPERTFDLKVRPRCGDIEHEKPAYLLHHGKLWICIRRLAPHWLIKKLICDSLGYRPTSHRR